jgi:hypothetical protein
MNPKPLEVLKNFTVPMVIDSFLVAIRPGDMHGRVRWGTIIGS